MNLPNPKNYSFKLREHKTQRQIFDICRKKYVAFTPEEFVRQTMLHYLVFEKNYPKSLIKVEENLYFNERSKRTDISIYNTDRKCFMLIECKQSKEEINEKVALQLLSYQMVKEASYLVLYNGIEMYLFHLKNGVLNREDENFPDFTKI